MGSTTTQSDAERWELAERIAIDIKENHMAPPGGLGLHPLLDERRLKYGIPDEAFKSGAAFDRVFVWQILPHHEEGKTYAGSSILLPETARKRQLQESFRGVLVSAGLKAMDTLKSNGIQIGAIVEFIRFGIYHKCVGAYAGSHEQHLLVLRDGDIIGCEDTLDYPTSEVETAPGVFEHRIVIDDKSRNPAQPFIDQSY